jgi:cytochrome c-type biogenesis protein CcmH
MGAGLAFWAAAAAMTAAAVVALAAALRRGRAAEPAAAFDRRVYADQLREIARDAARGVIPAEEAERLRAEVARRLLAADRAAAAPAAAARGPLAAGVALAALACGGAVAGYLWLGAPGYRDVPRADRLAEAQRLRDERPTQAAAEAAQPPAAAPGADADFLALMDRLRAKVAAHPDDLTGQELLARNEAALGNYAAAHRAQAQVIRLRGDAATSGDLVQAARWMIAAAGGAISPEAEAALAEALRRNRDDAEALFLMGLSVLRTGRPDLGFGFWRRFTEVAPADHPWLAQVQADLGSVAAAAGVDWQASLPPAVAGAAAGGDAPDAAAIRGMVEGLAARLAAEGGSAADWAQLIRALGVLGETDRARAAWGEAQGRLAGRPEDLALVRAAAQGAGVAE